MLSHLTTRILFGFVLAGSALGAGTVLGWVAWQSWREGERVACRRAAGLALGVPVLAGLLYLLATPGRLWVGWLGLAAGWLPVVVLLLPISYPHRGAGERARARLDERDTMFSRAQLQPGDGRYERYYARQPEKQARDAAWRALPGLLQPGSACHQPLLFAAARATFATVDTLHPAVGPRPVGAPVAREAQALSAFVKGWLTHLGAHSAGITTLRPEHVYAVGGRRDRYDRPLAPRHRYAVALTVEMDSHALQTGPQAPTVLESAGRYLQAGTLAVLLARFCAELGYGAQAHIDGNYEVVCPLVARDAGLGEIGRLGLLMTPALGPRVRIAVVTTDLPLVPDVPTADPAMIDFCRHCAKCATVCPARAIPAGEPVAVDGVVRWQVDQENCYEFWCRSGTDCGRCVAHCPYSHPRGGIHDLTRWLLRRSAPFRRVAARADDLLYGTKPPPAALRPWMNGRA